MRIFVLGFALIVGTSLYAGAVTQIPVGLLKIDNQGRSLFLENAIKELKLENNSTLSYGELNSVVIGGDEVGSDFSGALMGYQVIIETYEPSFERFACSQRLAVGHFDQSLTNTVSCLDIN